MTVDLFLLDFDGTLVNTFDGIIDAVESTLKAFKRTPLKREKIKSHIGYGPMHLISHSSGLSGDDAVGALDYFRDIYSQQPPEINTIIDGVLPFMRRFRSTPKIIFSNKDELMIRRILNHHSLVSSFDDIVTPKNEKHYKPSPYCIRELLSKGAYNPLRTVMIGDMPVDIAAGNAAGVKTCGVLTGLGTKGLLESTNPNYILNNLAEIDQVFN